MSLRPLVWLAAALTLGACGSSTPLQQYPDFPDRAGAVTHTRLVTDIVMDEDARGSRDRVTLAANRELGEALTTELVDALRSRGYRVDQTYPAAVGLYLDPGQVRTLRLADSLDVDVDTLASPPFFVSDAVLADTLLVGVLDHLVLARAAPGEEVPGPPLATTDAPEAVVLLTVRGRRVPLGKSIAQGVVTGVLTTLLTGGLVTGYAYQHSGSVVALDIVDASTGEAIWSDMRVQRGTASEGALRDAVRALVRRMPDRNDAAAPSAAPALASGGA